LVPDESRLINPPPRSARVHDGISFQVLRALEQQPDMSQRQRAGQLSVSLGKTNYLLCAPVEKGLLEARNFRNSQKTPACAYLFTPSGIEQKAELTRGFLESKSAEYKVLSRELGQPNPEMGQA